MSDLEYQKLRDAMTPHALERAKFHRNYLDFLVELPPEADNSDGAAMLQGAHDIMAIAYAENFDLKNAYSGVVADFYGSYRDKGLSHSEAWDQTKSKLMDQHPGFEHFMDSYFTTEQNLFLQVYLEDELRGLLKDGLSFQEAYDGLWNGYHDDLQMLVEQDPSILEQIRDSASLEARVEDVLDAYEQSLEGTGGNIGQAWKAVVAPLVVGRNHSGRSLYDGVVDGVKRIQAERADVRGAAESPTGPDMKP